MKHFFLALGVLLFLCGCEAVEDAMDMNIGPYDPTYVISIHKIIHYPRGGMTETVIKTFDGRSLTVATTPFLHSEDIQKIKLLPRNDRPGFYDLKLTLNPTGARKWMILNAEMLDGEAAILIDEAYYCKFQRQPIPDVDVEEVELIGPFDEAFALGLAKYGRKNYRHFSPRPTSIFL